jgi:protein gp37
MTKTAISWADLTWNPVTGCSKVSEGCRFCYAEALATKFGWSKRPWTAQNAAANVRERPERLGQPLRLKQPSRIFVNSMSDLFHERVSDAYIARVVDVIRQTPQHRYQMLTKRPERPAGMAIDWPENLWLGTSVEDVRVVHRIDALRRVPVRTRFLSCEPLLGPLPNLDLDGIHWVIVGGESGKNFRPMEQAWAREIRDQAVERGIAFFYKQDAAYRTETRTWLVEEDGSRWKWQQFPDDMRAPELVR